MSYDYERWLKRGSKTGVPAEKPTRRSTAGNALYTSLSFNSERHNALTARATRISLRSQHFKRVFDFFIDLEMLTVASNTATEYSAKTQSLQESLV